MSDLKVTGLINDNPVEFDETTPTHYKTDVDKSPSGAYKTEITAEDAYGNIGVAGDTLYTGDAFIEPIWWRTVQDVDRAKYINAKIAGGGLPALSTAEQKEWLIGLIGCLNYYDVNRIEHNTQWLSQMLDYYGYNQALACKVDWTDDDFPLSREMERIRSNIQRLINTTWPHDTQLPVTLDNPDQEDINAVERVLFEMHGMIMHMEQLFLHCGPHYSGEVR